MQCICALLKDHAFPVKSTEDYKNAKDQVCLLFEIEQKSGDEKIKVEHQLNKL